MAGVLCAQQFFAVKAAIGAVYDVPPPVGWGCVACLAGLLTIVGASAVLAASSVLGATSAKWTYESRVTFR